MFGLPESFDSSFLVGHTLLQACIGQNEVILRFDGELEISVEGHFSVRSGGESRLFESSVDGGIASLDFLYQPIVGASGTVDGTLNLEFPTGSIELYDSSAHYESYQIQHGSRVYVV